MTRAEKASLAASSAPAPAPSAAAAMAFTVVITCEATFSTARAVSASTPEAYGLKDRIDTPSRPSAVAT